MGTVVVSVVVLSLGVAWSREGGSTEMPESIRAFLEKGIGTWTNQWEQGDLLVKQALTCAWGPGKKFLINTESINIPGQAPIEQVSLLCWDGKSPDKAISYGVGPGGTIHENGYGKVLSETESEGMNRGVENGKVFTEKWHMTLQGPDHDTAVYSFSRTVDGQTSPVAKAVLKKVKTSSSMSKASPALKKLEVFVGDWTYEGEQFDPQVDGLPFEGSGEFHGESATRFVLGGLFLESKWQDKEGPSGQMSGFNITGYDTKTKNYTVNGYISDGSRTVRTASFDGRIWTSHSTMTTKKGEKILLKSQERYSSDWSGYTSTTELSVDDGKTWKLWYTEKGKKLKH
jgi:hypothetical protein